MTQPPSPAVLGLEQCSLQVSIFLSPSDVPIFFEAFQPVFEAVAKEPELLYFELFQDPDDEGHISWVENWNASPAWLMTVSI
jgi:quinol monooxygenase YgiN